MYSHLSFTINQLPLIFSLFLATIVIGNFRNDQVYRILQPLPIITVYQMTGIVNDRSMVNVMLSMLCCLYQSWTCINHHQPLTINIEPITTNIALLTINIWTLTSEHLHKSFTTNHIHFALFLEQSHSFPITLTLTNTIIALSTWTF